MSPQAFPTPGGFAFGTALRGAAVHPGSRPAPQTPTPQGMGSILELLRRSSLNQISYRSSPSVALVEARTVMLDRTIDIDQKNISLARTSTRHEYFRVVVPRNFEHFAHLIGDYNCPRFRTEKLIPP
jgi:hypothetical protein